jgi:hypothetical protein
VIGLERAVFLMAEKCAPVGAIDLAVSGEGIEIAAQRRHGYAQRLFQLLQRHGSVTTEELDDALPTLRGQQRRGVETFGSLHQFERSHRAIG